MCCVSVEVSGRQVVACNAILQWYCTLLYCTVLYTTTRSICTCFGTAHLFCACRDAGPIDLCKGPGPTHINRDAEPVDVCKDAAPTGLRRVQHPGTRAATPSQKHEV